MMARLHNRGPGRQARLTSALRAADDPQVCAPRPDLICVLRGEYSRGLCNVIEVVRDSRDQELAQRHDAELRVAPRRSRSESVR